MAPQAPPRARMALLNSGAVSEFQYNDQCREGGTGAI